MSLQVICPASIYCNTSLVLETFWDLDFNLCNLSSIALSIGTQLLMHFSKFEQSVDVIHQWHVYSS